MVVLDIIIEYYSVVIVSFQMGWDPLMRMNMMIEADQTSMAFVYEYLQRISGAMKRRVPHFVIADLG